MILRIFPTAGDTARELIQLLLDRISRIPEDRPVNIALSGGSTPALMFRIWAEEFDTATPWEHIHFFWVDERCVPPEDSQSNYGMTKRAMLDKVAIPDENIHRIQGENEPKEEAQRYTELVASRLPKKEGFPVFDFVLLGAGDDGHTSSIFPGGEHLLHSSEAYAVSEHPVTGQQRIALTGQPIIHSDSVIFLLTGSSKNEVLKWLYQKNGEGPAAYVAHNARHNIEIFTDRAAAGQELK